MQNRRRYTNGENIAYDDVYNNLRVRSWVLNEGVRRHSISSAMSMNDKNGLERTLAYLKGSKRHPGQYFNPEAATWNESLLPRTKKKLQEVEESFKSYQLEKVNWGLRKPKEWPEHLLNERYEAEARLDVVMAEIDHVEKKLKDWTEKENKKRVLPRGLQQAAIGVPILEIDGQNVSKMKGILVIDDDYSPYDGMAVFDYRDMANKWKQDVDSLVIKQDHLPDWPEGVKNYKTN